MRTHIPGPVDRVMLDEHAYRFGLCLAPGAHVGRARYRDHWNRRRFERLGHAFVIPPGEAVQVVSECGRDTSMMCELRAESIRAWLDSDLQWPSHRLEATFDIQNGNIRRLLLRLAEEARHPGFASEMLVELVALELPIELRRTCSALGEGPAAGGLAPWRLRRIDERVREVGAAPTLTELAALCRSSVRQLTRGFRASRGCSVGEYVAEIRVEHAKRLLGSEPSIKAIAHSLGFSSSSAFAQAFRRATGETPGQFRQRTSRDG
ncbi:MAG TPA: helix-turn-helix transcriptional regulator [Myxococcota bacterium]|nr:helix-turn-helix transcriptional regulator [Myxococcota bacterium]